jgi:hypothetical protein
MTVAVGAPLSHFNIDSSFSFILRMRKKEGTQEKAIYTRGTALSVISFPMSAFILQKLKVINTGGLADLPCCPFPNR